MVFHWAEEELSRTEFLKRFETPPDWGRSLQLPEIGACGILEDTQTKLRQYRQDVIKDIRLNALILNPTLIA